MKVYALQFGNEILSLHLKKYDAHREGERLNDSDYYDEELKKVSFNIETYELKAIVPSDQEEENKRI